MFFWKGKKRIGVGIGSGFIVFEGRRGDLKEDQLKIGNRIHDEEIDVMSLAVALGLCVSFGLFAKAFLLASVAIALLVYPFAKMGMWWIVVPVCLITVGLIVVFAVWGDVDFRTLRGFLSFMLVIALQFFLMIKTLINSEEALW